MTCLYPHRCPNRVETPAWNRWDGPWMCGCDSAPDTTAAGPGAALAGNDDDTGGFLVPYQAAAMIDDAMCSDRCTSPAHAAITCRCGASFRGAFDAGTAWLEQHTTEDGGARCSSVSPRPLMKRLSRWLRGIPQGWPWD